MKTPSSAPKIALLGPFGYGNLGDAAIQQAMLENIYQYVPNAVVFGVSMNPPDTEKRHGIPAFPIGRFAPGWGLNKPPFRSWFHHWLYHLRKEAPSAVRKIVKVVFWLPTEIIGFLEGFAFLKDVDLLVVSGGGQLDDYWGGAWHHPYTLMMWGFLARLRNVPNKFISVGTGTLDSRLSRLFERIALSLASYRSYRDEKSKNYIANVTGFNRDDPVYPDLAFSLHGIENLVSAGGGELQSSNTQWSVAIGPLPYFDPRIWPQKDRRIYTNYLNKLAELVGWLLEIHCQVVFIPGEMIQDRAVINDLKALFSQSGLDVATKISYPLIQTVDELLSYLASADFVIASRFHNVLLAQLLQKPVIALSYHAKIDELMADTGQADYCLQISDFDLEMIKARFSELEANRETACQQIAQRVEQYRAALDEQYQRIFGNY
ncbi:MAG: polysaccharide pyruvyl transferase family protein [Anaerolineales bacterium]